MHQRASFELKQRRRWFAIVLILLHGIAPTLPGAWILQFTGRHRHTIHCKQQIHRIVLAGMARHLSHHRQLVFIGQREYVIVQTMRGFEIGEAKGFAIKLEAVPQNLQSAL